MSIADKLEQIAENEPKVYEAGYAKGVEASVGVEPIPATATGTQFVTIGDVSEVPHKVRVQLSSDTITDFSNVNVTRIGKNLVDESDFFDAANWNTNTYHAGVSYHGYYELNLKENTTYTITWDCKEDFTCQFEFTEYDKGITPTYGDDGRTLVYLNLQGEAQHKTYTFTTKSGKNYGLFLSAAIQGVYGVQNVLDNWLYYFQVEVCTVSTGYEPYIEETYKANADGTVDGITSTRQHMTVFADSPYVTLTVGYNKSWGMQAAYNEFWDAQQDNGNRANGQYLYAGNGWNDTTFNPKHSLILTSAERMFVHSRITNVKSILEKNGIVFDFSQSTSCLQFCSNSTITHLGVLDFSNCTSGFNQVLYSANALESVEKLKIAEDGSQAFASTSFQGAGALTEIRIEGKFGVSVTFQWSPLSVASMKSIIAALMNYSGTEYANTCKITFSSACWAALEADSTAPDGGTWKEYVANTLCWNV